MSKCYFRYKVHPGDFFRNSGIVELPNPENNLENFLIWFLDNYQSDTRIAQIDDLSKLIDDEFSNEKETLEKSSGSKTKESIHTAIKHIEKELKAEAFENFYHLLLSNKIEIIPYNEK